MKQEGEHSAVNVVVLVVVVRVLIVVFVFGTRLLQLQLHSPITLVPVDGVVVCVVAIIEIIVTGPCVGRAVVSMLAVVVVDVSQTVEHSV